MATLQIAKDQQPQSDKDKEVAGFFDSLISAMTTELVGASATPGIQRYRAENPGFGLTSQILGESPLFIAPLSRTGLTTIRSLPIFGRGIRSGEKLMASGRPALGEAARDVSAMAAAETARLGTTAAIHGPTSDELEHVFGEAAFNLAATGAVSAAIGHMRRALPPANRPTNFDEQIRQGIDPEFNLNAPPQVKMRTYRKIGETAEDEGIRDDAWRHYAKARKAVREQREPRNANVVRKVVSDSDRDRKNTARRLSEMFKVKDNKARSVRLLLDSKKKGGLGKKDSAKGVIREANLSKDFESYSVLPRVVSVKTKEMARNMDDLVSKMSSPIMANGRQTWIAREADDGLYVMVRRVDDKMGRVEAGDRFITLKTDDPLQFGPELSNFSKLWNDEAFRIERLTRSKASKGSLTRAADAMEDGMPEVGILSGEMVSGSNTRDMARRIVTSIMGEERIAGLRAAVGGTSDFVGKLARQFAAPTIARYMGKNGSARAAAISLISKGIHDAARMRVTHLLSGTLKPTYRNSIFRDIFKQAPDREGGVFNAIDNLPKAALKDVSEAFRKNIPVNDMRRAGMNEDAIAFMKTLEDTDKTVLKDFNTMMKEIGEEGFDGMFNHYMLSRMWEGKLRLPVRKKNGNIVAIAGGKTKQEVLEEAERLKQVIEDTGQEVSYNRGAIRYADEGDDLTNAMSLGSRGSDNARDFLRQARDPKRFKERKGMQGFKGEAEDLTHKDLRDILSRQVKEMYNLAGERVTRKRLDSALHKLETEDPDFHTMIEKELMSRFGQRGNWTKETENAVDQLLTPLLGVRASQVVRTVNNAVFQLTLGMGNVGFAALNAVTFVQTALPEAAWLLTAPPSRVRDLYGHFIVQRPGGVVSGWSLEPLKLIRRAWNDMSKPPDELWTIYKRAVDEGRVAPVLAEQVMGPNSNLFLHMKNFLKEERTFPELLQEYSSYMPARTEELSRSISLSMGYRIGKEFYGLADDKLYQFATRFVDNTHFRYSASDRPLLLRGAFGSLVGLFKSWMLHYIGNMARYTGDASRRGMVAPLLWSQAGTMSVAGLSGSAVLPMAEGLNDALSDDPLVQNVYEGLGYAEGGEGEFFGSVADGLYFGLPAFLNLSLSHRAAVPGADIPNDIEQLYSVMHWDRAVALGQSLGVSWDAFMASGEHPARSQEVRDTLYRAFLPRTGQAWMQGVGERGTRSLNTQNTILSEMTLGERVVNALGFQPNELARTYAAMDHLFKQQEEESEAIGIYGEMMAQAMAENDFAAMQNILRRAMAAGVVKVDSIMQSAEVRLSKRQEGLLERQFDDAVAVGMRRAIGSQ